LYFLLITQAWLTSSQRLKTIGTSSCLFSYNEKVAFIFTLERHFSR
jgi:hypothetical protein